MSDAEYMILRTSGLTMRFGGVTAVDNVDFAIKEVALDFTKLRSAAYGLLAKGSQILSVGSNNAILQFLLEVSSTI